MASAAIKKAVDSGDIGRIRAALRISLTLDRNYTSGMFPEDLDFCREQGWDAKLYEQYDGRDLLAGRDTEESFDTLLGHLSTNFARERLNRLLALGKKLWPQEQESRSAAAESASSAGFASAGTGFAGTRREGGERILGERPVNVSGTSQGASGERILGERILGEREIPRDGSYGDNSSRGGKYGPSSSRSGESGGGSNFMVAAAVAVAVAAVVAAIVILT